jgi:hypothetical protein
MGSINYQIQQAIVEAAAFLKSAQEDDGGFTSWSSFDPNFQSVISYKTTFFPSLILGAIGPCVEQEFDDIKQRIVNFLLAQRSQQWTFNYWQKESLEYEQLPYPDDLDDTFCALSSMYKFDPGLITGEALAAAINVLTAQEVKPGGPYRTWLVGE